MKELYPGDRGTLVQYVQLALTRAGHPAVIDGIFGEKTCTALQAFLGGEHPCEIEKPQWGRLLPYLKGYTTYQVKEGDTFWELAQRLHSNVRRIVTANPTVDPQNMQAGTVLIIPYDFPLVSEEVDYSSMLTDWILEGLMVRYPFLHEEPVGSSVMGRRLTALHIGEGRRQVFYNAAFHANEWITTPVLLKFAEEYAQAVAQGGQLYR